MSKKKVSTPVSAQPPARHGEAGIGLLIGALRQRQRRRQLPPAALAKLSGLSVESVQHFQQCDPQTVRILDLIAIGRALGAPLHFGFAPQKPQLPVKNTQILAAFDRLIKSKHFAPFYRKQPDQEHPAVRWDIVGDPKSNWLFVVATNTKTKARFAKVTDEPGGWAIAGQVFGIDAETDAIAREMSEQLFQEHRRDLVDQTARAK